MYIDIWCWCWQTFPVLNKSRIILRWEFLREIWNYIKNWYFLYHNHSKLSHEVVKLSLKLTQHSFQQEEFTKRCQKFHYHFTLLSLLADVYYVSLDTKWLKLSKLPSSLLSLFSHLWNISLVFIFQNQTANGEQRRNWNFSFSFAQWKKVFLCPSSELEESFMSEI